MARSSTTFPPKWSEKTTVIRVPESLSRDLLRLAELADQSPTLREEIMALIMPVKAVKYSNKKEVNVASVPQRSPFRYPGGKTWLIPHIRDWLKSRKTKPARLIEPFAGGAAVSLTAVVTNGQAEWLAQQILNFDLTEKNVRAELAKEPGQLREIAFQTILRNRVQRGGIMAPGAGLIKTGEGNRGLRARWYPVTLARRIREINTQKDKLTFIEGDAFALIRENASDEEAVFYVDPPYTVAAKRLYSNWEIDHDALFAALGDCKGDFLMSYDNAPDVLAMVKRHGFESKPVAMKSTHHAKMTELLIGRNLKWLK